MAPLFVAVLPDALTATAINLSGIGSTITTANTAAAASTTGVLAAGADEISAAIAAVFSGHALDYQAFSAQAAAFHQRFEQLVNTAGSWYATAESANASQLQILEQQLLDVVNAPTQTLLGRPLVGNGANAPAGSGLPGAPGGLLYGNGGNGGS
ncbi:MAG: PE family protein, partial [Mycobacterium gordonae]|nr:PE family protein [Mycobacterium gordonae]